MVTMMLFTAPDPAADPYFARIVLDLQRQAYAVEARLLGDDRLPPLQESLPMLAAWRGRWLMAWDGVRLLGAVAWSDHGDALEIDRLMVTPAEHRRGIGTALVQRVMAAAGVRPIHTATGRDNAPAIAVYRSNGFEPAGDEEVPPGIWITHLTLR